MSKRAARPGPGPGPWWFVQLRAVPSLALRPIVLCRGSPRAATTTQAWARRLVLCRARLI
jgi:hypothetical protein